MKRSFTLVCLLASATGVGIVSSPSSALAQAPSAPTPAQSAGRLAAAPEVPANPKIAIIAFQQAVAATNEGST